MKNKCIKIYFSDLKETFLVYIVMIAIVSLLLILLRFPFYFHFVNLLFIIYYIIYFRVELKMFSKIKKDLKNNNSAIAVVTFDKIETDMKYGRQKRKEFFKKYTTPRYSFYHEKQLYRIGFNIDPLLYNDIRGKEFEIEYLRDSKLIVNIKPCFTVKQYDKEKYIKCFGNCSFMEEKNETM